MDADAIAAQEEADWAGLEDLDVDEYLLGIEGDDDGASGGGDSAANDDFGAGNQVCVSDESILYTSNCQSLYTN